MQKPVDDIWNQSHIMVKPIQNKIIYSAQNNAVKTYINKQVIQQNPFAL